MAGPDRDDWDNEVGTMFVAIATPESTYIRALNLGNRPMRERAKKADEPAAFGCAVEAGQDLVPLRHEHFGAGDHAVHRGVDTELLR